MREDLPRLREVFSLPEVTRWWPEGTPEDLLVDALAEGSDPVQLLTATLPSADADSEFVE